MAEYKAKPVGEGMTAPTMECIVGSDDDNASSSEEESSDEEGREGGDGRASIVKRKGKLTRAQRNKQKRVKAERTSLEERRR